MPLPGGSIANILVNWLSPTKIRQTVIGGSRRQSFGRPDPAAAPVRLRPRVDLDLTADTADLAEQRAINVD